MTTTRTILSRTISEGHSLRVLLSPSSFRILGVGGVLSILREGHLHIHGSVKSRWYSGIPNEIVFWDKVFRTKGFLWPDEYVQRLDPEFPLQKHVRDLLPQNSDIHILDVGAGPYTVLGKKSPGKTIHITAVDALADVYSKILERYGVNPPVRTENLDAEKLTSRFASNTFDLVYARNCLDHSYNPEQAIVEMISVVKPNGYVLLEHYLNEGESTGYRDLHQWNFSVNHDGEFVIRSQKSEINMARKYSNVCSITCEVADRIFLGRGCSSGKKTWLITKIRKI